MLFSDGTKKGKGFRAKCTSNEFKEREREKKYDKKTNNKR